MKPEEEQGMDELRAALRADVPAPPLHDVDWNALHGSIAQRAAPLLEARRGQVVTVWQTLSSWSRRGIPLTMAAAAAVLLALGLGVQRVDHMAELTTAEEMLAAGLNTEASLLASNTDDELLDALLFSDEGEH